ncbi:MAG: type I-U CRISPR-associated protein Csb2 [Acidimicrobiales bacterium]
MFAIEVTLLTGRFVATDPTDRDRAEWPPHPARLFSALVAASAEEEHPDDWSTALEWLERQGPPDIDATPAWSRSSTTHYVPVNDSSVLGLALTTRRAAQIEDAQDQIDELVSQSGGQLNAAQANRIARLESQVAKRRDVSAEVANLGRTSTLAAEEMMPERRGGRQARTFPSCTPESPVIRFLWPAAHPDPTITRAIDDICAGVARLGHSSSLVSVRVAHVDDTNAALTPDPTGSSTLRWVQAGQLRALRESFENHRASRPRTMPSIGFNYRRTDEQPAKPIPVRGNLSGPWLALELAPRKLSGRGSVAVSTAVRRALMSHAEDPQPQMLSGHSNSGAPASEPHLAVVPLVDVGHRHAHGQILGVALIWPTGVSLGTQDDILAAVGRWLAPTNGGGRLVMGPNGVLTAARTEPSNTLVGLRAETWSGPSRRWISATPIALPRHPGDLRSGSPAKVERAWAAAEAGVRAACKHVGLPEPAAVSLAFDPLLNGADPAKSFPALRQGRSGGTARALIHAEIEFAEAVAGPLVLGSGRFHGLGLMRPVSSPGRLA